MPTKIIVLGGSSGAIGALMEIVGHLPPDLPAALFAGVHLSPRSESMLPGILGRAGALPAAHVREEAPIEIGRIYVAPPDYHMLLKRGAVYLTRGPRENNHRPAIDPLFRSAALSYGTDVIGVLLSGNLDDGTAGLLAIKQRGGAAVVQDPADAAFPDMPRSALLYVKTDYVVPAAEIAPVLVRLVNAPIEHSEEPTVSAAMRDEIAIEELNMAVIESDEKNGKPSVFGCPDCGGTLWEMEEADLLRFRCRVGHAYTAESLAERHGNGIEEALWMALRALEENATLQRRVAARARRNHHDSLARRFEAKAIEAETRARKVRNAILAEVSKEVGSEAPEGK